MKMKTLKLLYAFVTAFMLASPAGAQTDNQKAAGSINFDKLGTYVPGKLYYKDGRIEEWEGVEYQNPGEMKKLDNDLHYNKPGQMARAGVNKDLLEAVEIGGNRWVRIEHDGDLQFGIMHIDGAIMDYSVFRIPEIRVSGDYKEERYIRKLDGDPIRNGMFALKYKKTIARLVEDDTELAAKVKNKEKGYKGIFNYGKVLEEYNAWHKEHYPEMYE